MILYYKKGDRPDVKCIYVDLTGGTLVFFGDKSVEARDEATPIPRRYGKPLSQAIATDRFAIFLKQGDDPLQAKIVRCEPEEDRAWCIISEYKNHIVLTAVHKCNINGRHYDTGRLVSDCPTD